jgi:hypothetical protein
VGLQDNLDALPLVTRQAIESSRADGVVQIHADAAAMSASVRTRDGRWVRIHSGRDPVREADRFLDAALPEGLPHAVFVIGAGLGYVLGAIERRSATTKVIAIEPFPAIARAMLERRDWREWIQSGRLTIVIGPHYLDASDAWKALDPRAAAPAILDHPVLAREFPDEIARAHRLADAIVLGARGNDDARKKFAGRYLLNTIANLPALVAEGDVASLRDVCRGVPAIVVAAGPSLDDNIQQLRGLDDRVLIVAVDTALRPLRAAGIRPHLVVAVDPSELNAKHLLGVADTGGSWLVGEGSIDGRVFSEFTGRAFSFKVSDHHPWPWLRAHGLDRGALRAWGSVLTTAFDLACHVGCNPVVFAGADLAYTNGVHYCRGTIHEDAANHRAPVAARADAFAAWQRDHQRTTCTETDIHGDAVVSTPDFVQFRDWLASRSAEVQPRRVLNATGAGILRGGAITPIDLATMSFPPLAEGAEAIQARLDAAWRQSIQSRDRVIEKLEGSMWRQNGDGLPLAAWLDFAGDTTSSEQIVSGVGSAWQPIARAWKSPPQITAHPASAFWIPGGTASFTAEATGAPPPSVQWQMSTDGGSSWSIIVGATDTTYECAMTAAEIGTQFRATFTNTLGSRATAAATITSAASGVVHDFNGDGKPDILLHSLVTGENVVWYMDGVAPSAVGVLVAVADADWMLVGAGDFDGGGKTQVLWRHSAMGQIVAWSLDGVTRAGYSVLEPDIDLTWTIVGTADFNGDGRSDILWRNAVTGANCVWHMDGMTRTGSDALDAEPDLAWTVVGTADFKGDGRPDILWRNTMTGANRVWYMDGVTRTRVGELEAQPDLSWAIIGAGDFNGDGQPDILWHNSATGATVVWHMNGLTRMELAEVNLAAEVSWTISAEESERRGGGTLPW